MNYPDLQTQAQAALGAVVASMPTEGKTLTAYLAALHKRDIVALGEDEAFLLADKELFLECRKKLLEGNISIESAGELPYKTALIKAKIVEKDPYEKGDRIFLNLGHTFAHALEKIAHLSHGEAVGTGLVLAAKLSVKLGLLAKNEEATIEETVAGAGLPVKSPVPVTNLAEYMKKDKKRISNTRR